MRASLRVEHRPRFGDLALFGADVRVDRQIAEHGRHLARGQAGGLEFKEPLAVGTFDPVHPVMLIPDDPSRMATAHLEHSGDHRRRPAQHVGQPLDRFVPFHQLFQDDRLRRCSDGQGGAT